MSARYWLPCVLVFGLISYGLLPRKNTASTLSQPSTVSLIAQPSVLEVRHESKPLRGIFQLRNTGTVSIEIVEITATCGCTLVGEIPKQPIAPGQERQVEVQTIPPEYGEKKSYLTIRTEPTLSHPLVVTVKLKGAELPAPFVSYAPEVVVLSGTEPSTEVKTEFEVQTVELADAPYFLNHQQCDLDGLRIWFEDVPHEEPLFDGKVRRVYKLKVARRLPQSDIETTKDRHVLVTETTTALRPPKTITIESHVTPLVKVVPSIVNLTVQRNSATTTESTFALIDSRDESERKSFEVNVESDWIQVEKDKLVKQPDRSIQTFRLSISPGQLLNQSSEKVIQSQIKFMSATQGGLLVNLPVRIHVE